ncbi:unnamed protein product, partial [Polarella glacialis]
LLGSCVVYLLQFFLLSRVGAIRQTLMDQLALVVGVSEGALFRGEFHDASGLEAMLFFTGAGLVLTGSALLYRVADRHNVCQATSGETGRGARGSLVADEGSAEDWGVSLG